MISLKDLTDSYKELGLEKKEDPARQFSFSVNFPDGRLETDIKKAHRCTGKSYC